MSMHNPSSSTQQRRRPGGPFGGGPTGMMRGGEKARDFKGTMRKLLVYLAEFKVQVIVVLLFAIASTVFAIIGPKILGKATTKLFEGVVGLLSGSGAGIDFTYIGNIILLLIALYLVSMLFNLVQGWIMAGVSTKLTYRFRAQIAAKINRLPLRYFDGTSHGEVLSRITNDVDTVNQTLSQSMAQIISSVVTMIGVLVMMFSINWIMSLVALFIIPLSAVIISLVVMQ